MRSSGDPFLDALDQLEVALEANLERAELMKQRMEDIRRRRAAGQSYLQIVPEEQEPLIVHLLTDSAVTLDRVGAQVRRTEARVLHEAGMTMDQIARIFRVSRQRISALLRER